MTVPQPHPSQAPVKRIGFLRILNEEETIAACLLSIAPVLDHIVITWSDTRDKSIQLARAWEKTLMDRHQCSLSFLPYPHHVVPPHSVNDLRTLPPENRIDTYLNNGLDHIRSLFSGTPFYVTKVDGDQIYFTREMEQAFRMLKTPGECVSIHGHNTLVHQNRFMLFKPGPINGGRDSLICGMDNLPSFGIAAPYEIDTTPHPHCRSYPVPCWMHFMRKAKYHNVIRDFQEHEVMPLVQNGTLMEKYRSMVLPLLQETESPYARLRLD